MILKRVIEHILVVLIFLPGVVWLNCPFDGISNIPIFWIFTFALSLLNPLVTLILSLWAIAILYSKNDRGGNRLKVLLLLLFVQFIFQGAFWPLWLA